MDSFLARVVDAWREAAGGALEDVYRIGSLAHGGFSEAYSDVDVAVILSRELPAEATARALNAGRAADPKWGPRLSVFHSDRGFAFGRFPALDRVDLIDHGVSLTGRPKPPFARPPLAALRAQLLETSIPYWRESTRRLARRDETLPDKERLRCALYPARLLLTWETGRVSSNDEAAAYLDARPRPGLDPAATRLALEVRRGRRPVSDLALEPAAWEARYAAALAALGEERAELRL